MEVLEMEQHILSTAMQIRNTKSRWNYPMTMNRILDMCDLDARHSTAANYDTPTNHSTYTKPAAKSVYYFVNE